MESDRKTQAGLHTLFTGATERESGNVAPPFLEPTHTVRALERTFGSHAAQGLARSAPRVLVVFPEWAPVRSLLHHATTASHLLGADLTLLRVLCTADARDTLASACGRLAAARQLSDIRRVLEDVGVSVRCRIAEGRAAERIRTVAAEEAASLVVIPVHDPASDWTPELLETGEFAILLVPTHSEASAQLIRPAGLFSMGDSSR